MADKKISALPAAGEITGTETFPIVQGGTTKKALTSAFAASKDSVISKDAGVGSALDIVNNTDNSGHLLRGIIGSTPTRPTFYFNGGGHFFSVASVTVSGVWNGLEGDDCLFLPPTVTEPHVLAAWSDVDGPTFVSRSNIYAGQAGSLDACPALFMSGIGAHVLRIMDDGSLKFGALFTRESMDTRLWRKSAAVLSIGDGTPDDESGTVVARVLAGDGVELRTGANARMGRSTLVAGAVTVSNTSITDDSNVFVQRQIDGGTVSASYSVTRIAGTSFTLTGKDGAGSNNTADTSTLAWQLIEPYVYTPPYGSELVINGEFAANITGWSVYPTIGPSVFAWDGTGERLHAQNTSTGDRGLFGQDAANAFAVESGKNYRVRATLVCVSGVTCQVGINKVNYATGRLSTIDQGLAPGTYSYDSTWSCTNTESVHITADFGNNIGDCYLDDVSVQEIL